MLPSKLRAAVLQATTFYMFTLVFDHHHGASVWDPFLEDEGFQNMSYVLGNLSALNSTGSRPSMLAIDAEAGVNTTLPLINGTGRVGNWTSGNSTTSAREELPDEDFYTQILPRKFVVSLILYALQYYWFIFLEKMLPARPRRRLVAYQHDEKVEETEDREEEVVKKWLAQGRVRRASLNWCNTFLKWVLQVTMGRPAHVAVAFLIEDIILRRSAKQILSDFKFVSSLRVCTLRFTPSNNRSRISYTASWAIGSPQSR